MDLAAILDYEMTPDEAQAYKIAVLWEKIASEQFPEYKHGKLRKRGDPRKSNLFKVAWTLHERTKGVLAPDEYKYYVLAQLSLLRELNKVHGDVMISPQCLLGDKAWVRWKVWKRKLDEACKTRLAEDLKMTMSEDKLRSELGRSRQFLMQRFDGVWTRDKLLGHVTDLIRWVASGTVSPYYAVASPWCTDLPQDRMPLDLSAYRKQLPASISTVFCELFPEERMT
jgi:hypothetical protein